MYIDTHAHLCDDRFKDKESIVKSYKEGGIEFIINVGYNVKTSRQGAELSRRFDSVFFAAGIHPSDSKYAANADLKSIEGLLNDEKCIAVGEIGLDYHYDGLDIPKQKRIFEEQIVLAEKYSLPVVIHSRDAAADMIDILKSNKNRIKKGVMHCYSGSRESVRDYLELGYYISFAGPVTFENNRRAEDIVRAVPLDRVLTETDCPYLTPEPHRGKLNEPAYVKHVADRIAGFYGLSVEKLNAHVRENTLRLFDKIKL